MPLEKGSGREVVSRNISEMVKSGHPQKQAVAASLRQARDAQTTMATQPSAAATGPARQKQAAPLGDQPPTPRWPGKVV